MNFTRKAMKNQRWVLRRGWCGQTCVLEKAALLAAGQKTWKQRALAEGDQLAREWISNGGLVNTSQLLREVLGVVRSRAIALRQSLTCQAALSRAPAFVACPMAWSMATD